MRFFRPWYHAHTRDTSLNCSVLCTCLPKDQRSHAQRHNETHSTLHRQTSITQTHSGRSLLSTHCLPKFSVCPDMHPILTTSVMSDHHDSNMDACMIQTDGCWGLIETRKIPLLCSVSWQPCRKDGRSRRSRSALCILSSTHL